MKIYSYWRSYASWRVRIGCCSRMEARPPMGAEGNIAHTKTSTYSAVVTTLNCSFLSITSMSSNNYARSFRDHTQVAFQGCPASVEPFSVFQTSKHLIP